MSFKSQDFKLNEGKIMDLGQIFGDKSLSYAEFTKLIKDSGIKLANLAGGEYVDKGKYEALEKKHGELSENYKKMEESLDVAIKGHASESSQLKDELSKIKQLTEQQKVDLEKTNLNNLIKLRLVSEGVKGDRALAGVLANLDLSKVKLDGDQLLGINDQIGALKEELPALFSAQIAQSSQPKVSDANNLSVNRFEQAWGIKD